MRVLWFSPTPSLYNYNNSKGGGWVASLEKIVKKQLKDIELGVAFEAHDDNFKIKQNRTTYYPIRRVNGLLDSLKVKIHGNYDFHMIKDAIEKIINDFKPEIIHCFGSEWSYAMISTYVNVPVVVHMQGFLDIYSLSSELVYSKNDEGCRRIKPSYWLDKRNAQKRVNMEVLLMKNNQYFMGRTNWDKNIVKYYSPNSYYYYCPESIRSDIYDSEEHWSLPQDNHMKIVSISSGNRLKGNEIILRTAYLLKTRFGFNFEWRVAGDKWGMADATKRTGIHPDDVNIKMIGRISSKQIVNELCSAHCYVHPAVIDNSPNSLCEAQLIGCPVIAANVGGIPQMVNDGKTGLLYPYNEPHTLSFTLMHLFDDKILMKELSLNEIAMSKDRHDPIKLSVTLHSIYVDIISKHHQS